MISKFLKLLLKKLNKRKMMLKMQSQGSVTDDDINNQDPVDIKDMKPNQSMNKTRIREYYLNQSLARNQLK